MNQQHDDSLSPDDQKLMAQYQAVSNEMPSADVDKVIFAAMRRELDRSEKKPQKNTVKLRFWERLRLPVSMMGALVMTVTLAHIMWPMIAPQEGATEFAGALDERIQVSGSRVRGNDENSFEYSQEEEAYSSISVGDLREKQSKSGVSSANLRDKEVEGVFYDSPVQSLAPAASARSEETKTFHRDQWVQRILKLAKEQQFDQMNQELKGFKLAYPNYPISEQLNPLLK